MEQVPSPLRVGSPAMARKQSVDNVPAALRAGSPAVDRAGSSFSTRPPLMRHGTSQSDRLSQLFPSRPSSVASPSSDPASSRRTSYPSPLLPAAEPAYRKQSAPPPPSFAENTAYDPMARDVSPPISPPATHRSRTTGLMNRLQSLRGGQSKGTYNRLDDEETGTRRKAPLRNVEEEEHIPYDLSGFDGMPMSNVRTQHRKSVAETREQEQDASFVAFTAEYERLEAKLGAGMSAITEVPFTHTAQLEPKVIGHKRGLSNIDVAAQDAQKAAEETGGIVAVADISIDISDSFGATFDTQSVLTTGQGDDGSKTSYYFPEDPDMPSWRPFSMGWPWLSMLIVVALLLAALQEALCQLSQKKIRDDPKGGLLKFKKAGDIPIVGYFTWKYAPVLTFIIYGILWQVSDFEVKRLEPFYQLSKKSGATAAESLNMDYLTFMSWLVPFRALRHKQYAVIYSSLGTLVASSLVPVLQSASVNMYPPKAQRKDNEYKSIRIDPPWSRAVSGCLVFVAICGGILVYEMRRKSGLLSDPKGIAGVAALATRSHILTDFHGLDVAPLEKIHKQLRHRRYILHKSSLWQGEYIRNSTERVKEHGTDPRPLMLRLRAGVPFICYLILFTISIPIFMFVDGANTLTEKVPILLTALATMIKLLWGTMNSDIRMVEPFYILAKGKAPPKTLTLDYTGTNPIFLPVKSFLNKHYLVALVGFGGILTEILTVCVSSFSVDGKSFIPGRAEGDHDEEDDDRYNTDQTFRSFWISFALVIGILFILVSIACLAYLRRSHKFMPRQIGTMASVLAFIHQSKMLVHFIDTEKMNSTQMTAWLENKGKTYALGWFTGRDGDDHCGIDEEPLLAPYQYGVDWTRGRVQGNQIGTWEHYEVN